MGGIVLSSVVPDPRPSNPESAEYVSRTCLQRQRIRLHFNPHGPERMPPCAVHRHTAYCNPPVPTASAISSVG